MKLKTVTRNIAFALLAVAMTGVVISSCSTDEYDDCGLTMAKRKVNPYESSPTVAYVSAGCIDDNDFERKTYSKLKYKISWSAGFAGTIQELSSRATFGRDSVKIVTIKKHKNELYSTDTIQQNHVSWGGMGDDYINLEYSIIAKHTVYYIDEDDQTTKSLTEQFIVHGPLQVEAVVQPLDEFNIN